MGRLVDDLLLLARLDETRGVTGADARAGDLAAVADRVVGRGDRQRAGVVRVTRTGGGPARVQAPDDVLERIVVNLVENGVRYARSRVDVAVERAGPDVLLTVTDDGPGVPAGDRDRVFERFTRLDDARSREEGGSGLGLAIVRELARAHGGEVHLDDAAPGLRAVVRLPAAGRESVQPA
jgi:signal transduction histidine kinase